jgi:hypothetical protein
VASRSSALVAGEIAEPIAKILKEKVVKQTKEEFPGGTHHKSSDHTCPVCRHIRRPFQIDSMEVRE